MTPNPYEVLRLDPSATEEEIVRQASRLRQRAADEATLTAIRQATQALTGRAEERSLHALLTHPQPCYHWPALERFAAAFRRPPSAPSLPTTCPSFDLPAFAGQLEALLVEELDWQPPAFEPVPLTDDAAEIERQSMEALWRSLLYDTRA